MSHLYSRISPESLSQFFRIWVSRRLPYSYGLIGLWVSFTKNQRSETLINFAHKNEFWQNPTYHQFNSEFYKFWVFLSNKVAFNFYSVFCTKKVTTAFLSATGGYFKLKTQYHRHGLARPWNFDIWYFLARRKTRTKNRNVPGRSHYSFRQNKT